MNNSEKLTYEEVLLAHQRIEQYISKTPLDPSLFLNDDKRQYYFKLECYQTVKSFKIRGALNKVLTLSEEEKKCGIATISSGNHGVSVSYAAKLLGIEHALVIVPETTPDSKIARIEFFGARVLKLGRNYDEAYQMGMDRINRECMTYIDPYYSDVKVYAGQGTTAVEILKQRPTIDTLVVPIGGGGLITGISVAAKAMKPSIRIVGVQTKACPAMFQAIKDHVFYEEYPSEDTLCDALVGGIGKRAYKMADQCIDDVILVSEEEIAEATAFALKKEKIMIEPSSATTIAAIKKERERIGGNEIALVLSGGNISEQVLIDLVAKK